MIERIRILLVDDHVLMRDGIRAALEREGDMEIVAEAGNSAEAVAEYQRHAPDLSIIDLRLPDRSGAETVQLLRRINPEARCFILSTFDGDQDIRRAMAAGAMGYLVKSLPRAELVKAVREIHAGNTYLPTAVSDRLNQAKLPDPLSNREAEVLRLIAKGLSDKEIAAALSLSVFTVHTHVRAVLRKLGVQDRLQAAIAAVQRGFAGERTDER